ncbi:MAG: hypothetical protein HN348_21255, partial [Proteobacteria bacterium]|nr:hypothetical protein [Pseudomonadota bacterium]
MWLLLLGLAAAEPDSKLKLEYSGMLQTDIRFRLNAISEGNWYNPIDPLPQVARNRNIWKSKITAKAGDFRGVVDLDVVFEGFPQTLTGMDDLSSRQAIDPFRLEAHSVYLEARDLFVENLDLRIGQQLVQFGVGDQFNPTNSFNADDVEDKLLFGEQMSNLAVRLDFTAWDNWTATAVLIPIFKPALVPGSAGLGLAAVDRMPFIDEDLRWRMEAEKAVAYGLFDHPTVVAGVTPELPETSAENMQFGFRVGGFVGMQDIAVSYYRGFADFPVPTSTHTTQVAGESCIDSPIVGETCIDGLLQNQLTLAYPRIQVAGFNMAGEMNPLGWIHQSIQPVGYRLEFAAVFPERVETRLTQDKVVFIPIFAEQAAGEYEYELADGGRPAVLDSKPFLTWTAGLDYTLGRHIYVNAQWVHGMLDEMGGAGDVYSGGVTVRDSGVDSDALATNLCALNRDGESCAWETLKPRLGDYLVLGADVRFLSNAALFRLFTIWDLSGVYEERYDAAAEKRVRTTHGLFTKEGFSAVIFPELSYNFGNGFELGAGVLLQLGQKHS